VSNLFLTNIDMSAVTPSGAEVTRHKAAGAAGAASTLRNKNGVAGPTVPLKVTDSTTIGTDGNTIAWYSDQLQAVLIQGQIVCSLYDAESATTANIAPAVGIYRCDANGAELATIVNPATNNGSLEMASPSPLSDVVTLIAANVVDTQIQVGERIKIALFIDDAADHGGSGSMTASGRSGQFYVNGPTGSAGQSQIAFTETLVNYAPAIAVRTPFVVAQEAIRRSYVW
jgi:hypothetical protein